MIANDLISRQAAIQAVYDGSYLSLEKRNALANMIDRIPNAVPKKGKWIMVEDADEDGNARYECSLCHAGEMHTPKVKVPYCWNCGASMEECE